MESDNLYHLKCTKCHHEWDGGLEETCDWCGGLSEKLDGPIIWNIIEIYKKFIKQMKEGE